MTSNTNKEFATLQALFALRGHVLNRSLGTKEAYYAAKHGLVGLTKVCALETATTGVTCNAICPGWVLTPLVQKQVDAKAAAMGLSMAGHLKTRGLLAVVGLALVSAAIDLSRPAVDGAVQADAIGLDHAVLDAHRAGS